MLFLFMSPSVLFYTFTATWSHSSLFLVLLLSMKALCLCLFLQVSGPRGHGRLPGQPERLLLWLHGGLLRRSWWVCLNLILWIFSSWDNRHTWCWKPVVFQPVPWVSKMSEKNYNMFIVSLKFGVRLLLCSLCPGLVKYFQPLEIVHIKYSEKENFHWNSLTWAVLRYEVSRKSPDNWDRTFSGLSPMKKAAGDCSGQTSSQKPLEVRDGVWVEQQEPGHDVWITLLESHVFV